MRNIVLLLTCLFALAGCNQKLKEKIGLSTTGPDEYKVQRGKSLEVPPHYTLPTPLDAKGKAKKADVDGKLNEGERALIEEIK